MEYTLTLKEAEKNTNNLIMEKRDYMDEPELKKLRNLRDQLGGAKKWSERLWRNYEYLMMINQ